MILAVEDVPEGLASVFAGCVALLKGPVVLVVTAEPGLDKDIDVPFFKPATAGAAMSRCRFNGATGSGARFCAPMLVALEESTV